MSDPHVPWLRLWRTPGIGARTFLRVLEAFGDPESFMAAPVGERRRLLGDRIGALPVPDPSDDGVIADRRWLDASPDHHLIHLCDRRYPEHLAALADPPPLLFVNGAAERLGDIQLGIVGSRKPTADGRANAHEFARHLAGLGMTVTSGLALGVDAAAHQGALDAGGCTVAATATGPDRVYPSRNRELARAIVEAGGALVTEFPVGTTARREHFPRRNRVISGLSVGVLVVEAGLHSGSLITARHALDQGREVFAVPGSIHNPLARGCHSLIRQGAKIVESAQDILDELPPLVTVPGSPPEDTARPPSEPAPGLDAEHARVLEALGHAPQPLDVLLQRTGLTPDTLSSILLLLELRGFVSSESGGRYARTGA